MVYTLPSLAFLPISAGLGLVNAMNGRSLHRDSFEDVYRYTVDLYGAVQDGYYESTVMTNRLRAELSELQLPS